MLNVLLFTCIFAAPVRVVPGANAAEVTVVARVPDGAPTGKLSQKEGERWLRFVLVSETGDATGPAMLGAYERTGETLTFTPRFRLAAGERYLATLTTKTGTFHAEYRVPAAAPAKPTIVEAIYPSTDELPANQLKFYLHFSKPMREGPAVFDRIKLLDEKGEEVEDPWRRTELWNEDATRLTLWIHPGRVKEGVNLRDELGPVLEANRKYVLVLSEKLLDADGRPLGTAFKKSFRTTAAVREAVELKDWKLTSVPQTGTVQALEVQFPRPLDRALLGRSLAVLDADGRPLGGKVTVGEKELSWSFRPVRPWKTGSYSLVADDRLEDLAGNTLLRPFDLNLKVPEKKDPLRTVPFRVAP